MDTKQNLFIKSITGNISEEEEKLLKQWLNESKQNRKDYETFIAIWESISTVKPHQMPEIDKEWSSLYERLKLYENKLQTNALTPINNILTLLQKVKIKSLFIPKLKPALNLALIIFFMIICLIFLNKENSNSKLTSQSNLKTIITKNKEHKNFVLPDGSKVFLNGASSVKFYKKFNEVVRQINLTGEAYFSVVKDHRPFVVITNNAKVTVLGTKFDVWARNEKTRVVVKEGKVALSSKKDNGKKVDLSSGQLSYISKDMEPVQPTKVNADNFLGWMNGKLVFNHTPLKEILNELEIFYDVKLNVENNNIANYTLSGTFELSNTSDIASKGYGNYNIDSILSMICLSLQLDYEKKQGEYFIKQRNNIIK